MNNGMLRSVSKMSKMTNRESATELDLKSVAMSESHRELFFQTLLFTHFAPVKAHLSLPHDHLLAGISSDIHPRLDCDGQTAVAWAQLATSDAHVWVAQAVC